jgi:glycosyltransferase involved in cell wall biosynthesis
VLYLSNLARAKGYLDLLRAAVRLAPEIPSLELVLAGDWYDGRREAEGLLVSEELAGRVHLPGVVTGETKQALLATANVFAFPPSQLEGQPLVLLEAMAAGLPIVTTNSGLIPETVSEGENAILVPSNNPEALAAALRTLWSDPALCARMGRASRALYLERYTLDRFRRNLAALVGELGLPF